MTPRSRRAAACAAAVLFATCPRSDRAAAAGEVAPPRRPALDPPGSGEARLADLVVYEQERETLAREAPGAYVVLARGRIAAIGATLDEVVGAEADAPHRFVFRVGEDGDETVDAPDWPSPRFAGAPFAAAMRLEWTIGGGRLAVLKDDEAVQSPDRGPHPRVRVRIRAPDGTALPAAPSSRGSEVLLDTVGPGLVVTPDDAVSLGLERFEVPGATTIGGLPCRRGLVRVDVPGLPGEATVVAAWPTAPRQALVEKARRRDRLWEWPADLAAEALAGAGKDAWIVFGCDRVLGQGASPEDALDDAESATDVAYHRWLLRLAHGVARPGVVLVDVSTLSPRRVSIADREVEARVGGEAPFVVVVSAADGADLPLDQAESPDEVRLVGPRDADRAGGAPACRVARRSGRLALREPRRGVARLLSPRPRLALVVVDPGEPVALAAVAPPR